ncbi:MAG TPA: hypothetical protein VKB96_06200, partial [Gammaproteobacteria bacterium]|nr:hypothetical protein [Gammaproteobacteria bacterium]
STQIGTIEELNSLRAYNFVLTVTMWAAFVAPFWLNRASYDRGFRLAMDVTTFVLIVIGIYFLVGVISDPSSAAAYLRNIVAPFLLFQIFALVAYRHRVSMMAAFVLLAIVALIYGHLELFAHVQLLSLVNGDTYIKWRIKQDYDSGLWLRDMQETGRVMRSYLDTLLVDFLNTPFFQSLGLRVYRVVGPNFHSISFAYALAFFAIVLFAIGQWWYLIAALPLILVIGSKGALVFMLLVTAGLVLMRHFRGIWTLYLYLLVLVAFAVVGIITGIQTQDYHVIGFIGGLNGFLSNPLGHGIGAGGNLSLNQAAINWGQSQHLGHTDVAVESAVGVLLYQVGIFGIVILAALGWVAAKLWKLYRRTGDRLYAAGALGLITIAVNGIFQEEALFAPLAFGMLAALAGLLLGRAYRTVST